EQPAIEADGLVRTYRTHTGVIRRRRLNVEAVRGVSFAVRPGELFGLLGPNGAGKTTTIKMLITLLLPTSGTARVMGHDVVKQTTEVRKRIGYVFGGDRGLYDRVSAMDNLRYFAELYGVDPGEQKRRIAALLELVGLTGREQEKVEGYSRGMRQRLHVARGLLHDPQVVFLDEPSIGLDPVGARELRQTIRTLVDAGKTVLLTTHYMFEADALCDRIAVINDGLIVAAGTGADLKAAIANRTIVEIETFGVSPGALEALRADPDVIAVNMEERDQSQILLVQSERGTQITQRLLGHLAETRVGKVVGREPTLEDAYVHLIATTTGADGAAARAAAQSV
ncbi:MAG TPA: ABC transporter ATP-binding protein, partial [Candidatus Limnocylindrales bacterium]|nr:ABC transporter ATP-binding protein [Candidatus Limnocylindrales bacterium]